MSCYMHEFLLLCRNSLCIPNYLLYTLKTLNENIIKCWVKQCGDTVAKERTSVSESCGKINLGKVNKKCDPKLFMNPFAMYLLRGFCFSQTLIY